MSKAEALFNLMPQVRQHNPPRKALIAARNAAMGCSVEELSEFYRLRAYNDAAHLGDIGCPLRDTVASPTVHQGGSDESSRPKAGEADSEGSEQPASMRSEGTPLTAEKSGDAEPTLRSNSGSDSPSDQLLGFLKET